MPQRDESKMGMSFACYHGQDNLVGHQCDGYTLTNPNEQLYRKCKCVCHLPYEERHPDTAKEATRAAA